MKNILFFAHYNKYNLLPDYILYLLDHIQHIYDRVVFVSNSKIPDDRHAILAGLCHSIIIRENKGFDFGAWKDALLKEGWDTLIDYDAVTLMNDTCFGPLYDLRPVYEQMETRKVDFLGLTNLKQNRNSSPYVQSYFICFNKNIIRSLVFQQFWNNVKYLEKYKKVIRLYEARLTAILCKAGFIHSVLFDTTKSDNTDRRKIARRQGVAILRPDLIIKNKLPLVKVKAFGFYPVPYRIIELIRNLKNYPPALISEYYNTMYEPNTSFMVYDRFIYSSSFAGRHVFPPDFNLKIAVHLHVYFLDVFERYIYYFNKWQFKFDLYITTNSHEKKTYIEKCVKNGFNDKQLAKIVVTENIGRDVLPWLSLSERLKNYDIVGHFHTKKSDHADFWIGEIWQEDMFEMLLVPANEIMEIFYNNPDIGMIIPDMASCFHIRPHIFLHENTNKRIIKKLWRKMKCTKSVRFKDLTAFIMPYGNMFWYRPVALKPLFDLGLSAGDFPGEPLPVDSTITHAIERITLYVSWNSGYDFRIIKNEKPLCNSFIDNMSYIFTYSFVLKSKTYLIAKILFFLPRMTRKTIAELTNIIKRHYNYSKKHASAGQGANPAGKSACQ